MIVPEKYHVFRRGDESCRYGVLSLTRDYYTRDQPSISAEEEQYVALDIPEPRIRVAQAVITSQCNLTCTYCSFNANAPKLMSSRMTSPEIEELCRWFNGTIGENGLLLVTGGEPELHRDAVDYLVANIRGKIILFTNGTLTNRDRLKTYRQNGVGVLFSLDGDLFAQDSVRRGKDGSYTEVADALKEAQDVGLDYGISAVVGDHNIDRLPELVQYIHKEFHPASLGLNLPHRYGESVWMRIEEYTDALIEIFTFAKETGLFIDQINRRLAPLIHRQFRFRDCAAQGGKVVIYPGGVKTSCVNEAALVDNQVDWGNRIPFLSEQCRNCFAIGICGGGCIFDGEAIYGPGQFDERNCYFTKKLLKHMIWDLRDELGEQAIDTSAALERYGAMITRPEGTHFSVGHETAR
jgi:radical SAM protein with 4Fe4S-binding SPASM domain